MKPRRLPLSTTILLNSRIIARKGEAPFGLTKLSYPAREKLLNPKFAQVSGLQKFPTYGDIHDIFAGDWHEKKRGRNFIFDVMSTEAAARKLCAHLTAEASSNEDWQFDKWIADALEQGRSSVAVKRDTDRSNVGFATVSATLSLEDHGGEATPYPTTYLNVKLDSVISYETWQRLLTVTLLI